MNAVPEQGRPIRVLVAKVGLDGHDRGAKVIATSLRDAGMEVIYTGLRQTPEMVVAAALQEDVDAIGISILSGAHMTVFPKVAALMKEKGLDDVLLTGGGIIPEEDMQELNEQGVGKLFAPGTTTQEIADYIRTWVAENPNPRSVAKRTLSNFIQHYPTSSNKQSMYSTITTALDNGIFTITINRPDKLNALNKDVVEELGKALDEVYSNNEIKTVLLTGSGEKAFVAGADISEFTVLDAAGGSALARKGQDNVFNKIENSPKRL